MRSLRKKYEFGGDFQAGVYAKGGSLESHGIKQGDTFLRTISGGIQKVKDKNGNIVYINLSTGERGSQPPLPFDDGGEVTYFVNKDGIRVRSKVEPEKKLTEAEWMAKHSESKEARSYEAGGLYGFGGLFSKAKETVKPSKYPKLEGKQVTLKNGKMVQVFEQYGSTLSVIELGKLGSGERPHAIDISEVDMTSFKNGGALIGNQKRIDMNHNGKIDAEDFKLLRSSMNGAWRNERKHVNHKEDYEVRYAKKKPARTGYKGKRNFSTGGRVNKDIEINPTIENFIDKLKKEGKYNKGNEQKNVNGVLYRFDEYKLINPSGFVVNQFKRIVEKNYGVLSLSNGYDSKTINLKGNKVIYANLPNNKGGHTDYITFRELVILNKTGGAFEKLSNKVAKNYEGKRVKPQYQKEYGKVYSKEEAKEVGNKVAGKVKAMQKAESGASVKKTNRGGVMVLAKQIRKVGESWKDALKRAGQQLK